MRHCLLLLVLILPFAGCVHTRSGGQGSALPPDAPAVATILDDLRAADRRVENFESNGEIRMRLPGEPGIQRFPQGRVRFQQPGQFFAQGRKLGAVVRVYSDGGLFLLELPSEKTFYYGAEGDQFEDIALDVAPSRIFQELFLIGLLDGISPERVVMESYSGETSEAVLIVYREGRRRKVERRLVVAQQAEGWCIRESQLFDSDGNLIGRTECESYERLGGALVPARVTVNFPEHEAEMSFYMSTPSARVNQQAPLVMDAIEAKRAALLAGGFREVRGMAKEAGIQ